MYQNFFSLEVLKLLKSLDIISIAKQNYWISKVQSIEIIIFLRNSNFYSFQMHKSKKAKFPKICSYLTTPSLKNYGAMKELRRFEHGVYVSEAFGRF